MRNKIVLENKPIWAMCKCMISNGNPLCDSQKWGIATKIVVSHQLLILGNKTGYQVKA